MSEIRTDTINNASGDNDSGIDLSTNDQVGIKTANTTAVTVDSSQNVGIGTSIPADRLHIVGSNGATTRTTFNGYTQLILENNSDTSIDISTGTTHAGFINFHDTDGLNRGQIAYGHTSDVMTFNTGGSERMRITSSGELLIGNTTGGSSSSLHVQGNGTLSVFQVADANSGTLRNAILFRNSSSSGVGSIQVNSTSTSYNTSSDHRLKENVTADWDATTRLKQLNPVRFNFIADADTTVDGFLAHEVQSVVPEAISGTHNEVDDDGNPVYQGIDQSKLVPLLVKTIQELEARIEALENA